MDKTFPVEIVSPVRRVWEGPAIQLIATTEDRGEIGILANHVPLIAKLSKSGTAEVVAPDGHRQIMAVSDGFISVTSTGAAIIAPYVKLRADINGDQARRRKRELEKQREAGDNSPATEMAYQRVCAQVKAADHSEKASPHSPRTQ